MLVRQSGVIIAANFGNRRTVSPMANKHLWPLVCTLALLTIVCACGGGSSNVTPPPPNPDSLYALTLSGPPPNLSLQLSNLKVDSSTGALGSPAPSPFWSQLVPRIPAEPASQ